MSRVFALWLLLVVGLLACGHPTPPFQILAGPPSAPFRTLGMVSGHGENRSSAVHAAADQAQRLDADAMIVVGERPVGRTIIVTARAIRYMAPPPPPH